MQLIKLFIEHYKNLTALEIDFSDNENVSVIIGNNGSGKSNIVEAISGIFAGLYLQSPYRVFRKTNKPKGTQTPFNFKIEYSLGDKIIMVEFKKGIGLIAKKAQSVVIPAYIKGSYKMLPKGAKFPKPVKLTTYYGSPIDLQDLYVDDERDKETVYQEISERIRAGVVALEEKARK